MIRKWNFFLLALLLALSACNLPLKITSSGTAKAWIDAPLDGMQLPLSPYTLVFHSSDPVGVMKMEVSINGQVLASLPSPDPPSRSSNSPRSGSRSRPGVTLSASVLKTRWGTGRTRTA